MRKLRALNIIAFLGASLLSVSCSAETACEKEVFVCYTKEPTPLAVKLCEDYKGYYLEQFIVGDEQIDLSQQPIQFLKTSYHRSMVDEHSVAFQVQGTSITVSDYHSEELGEITDELSVTLIKNDKKQYFECGGESLSLLPSLDNSSS
ncbi:hypothetical protein [Agarivorans albus]|uniref:Lipoprotein n=1 Tax=Agarivorans albus MKT 106 TaxID=1331007 RepID=R9PPU3_AGAAL|nr:hypothetical protein [Agarivorans albus]GAD00156.1 hypothetical protein AALB_0236 [Agarivorans albus MKT 106]